jgi:hypothetical protein|nr:MAG TPA: hypothetical protein [Caudoviricetes sp.]
MKDNKDKTTLDDIMRMVKKDNRCANAALILSALTVILIIACAIFKVFRPV